MIAAAVAASRATVRQPSYRPRRARQPSLVVALYRRALDNLTRDDREPLEVLDAAVWARVYDAREEDT